MKRRLLFPILLLALALIPEPAQAAHPTHTPTPIFTATPYPTYTPPATATPYPTYTAVPTATPYPQGPGPQPGTYCTGLFGWCPNLGDLLNSIFGAIGNFIGTGMVALLSPIEHLFSSQFDAVTSPFTHALTYTPDITNEDTWAAVRDFQTTLQQLAGVLFVGFLTIGVFGAYLGSIGIGDFAQITSPVRRAALVAGFIAGYKGLMATGFSVLNGVTGFITSSSLSSNESAWTALRGALITLHNMFGLQGVIDTAIVIIGLILALLCVVIRMMGLGMLAALYVVGPLALVTWLSPQFDFIARWWVKTFVGLALWPLGYAVGLKIIEILLTGGGPISEFSGLAAALGALGLLFGLYRVPAIVGSMVGAGGSLFGATASIAVDAAIGTGVALATRAFGRKIVPGP